MYYNICGNCGKTSCSGCLYETYRPMVIWTLTYPYNSEKYELVEKKDWKLNQLKKQLEEKKQSTEYYSKVIDKEINYLAELNKEIEQLESEINQLEEKKD